MFKKSLLKKSTLSVFGLSMMLPIALSACSSDGGDNAPNPAEQAAKIAAETGDVMDATHITKADWTGRTLTGIAMASADKLIVKQGDTISVAIEASDKARERLQFSILESTLRIGYKSGNWGSGWSDDGAVITVTLPQLTNLDLSGSGEVAIAALTGRNVNIAMAGSGNAKIDKVKTDNLNIAISGSGILEMAGSSKAGTINISGSGEVKGENLDINDLNISVQGSGDARLTSNGHVRATLAGSGNVQIIGKAKCKSDTVGSGEFMCDTPYYR